MRLFGTDGIRGEYKTKLSVELAFEIGKAASSVLKDNGENICIGKDPRISSDALESALISGLISGGMNVTRLGVVSTPVISYAIIHHGFDYGIMISASHNPYSDNGIKFFQSNGQKLNDQYEEKIESKYFAKDYLEVEAKDLHQIIENKEIANDYCKYIESLGTDLNDLNIALDCSNGSAFNMATEIFNSLGANVGVIGNKPDGININKEIGSTYPKTMSEYMNKKEFNFGFSYDGDADRVMMYDSSGNVMDGDYILYLLAKYYKENNHLHNDQIITTVMVNLGLVKKLKELNINTIQTQVGDRFVMEKIKENHATVGGEQSGHIIIPEFLPTGDGILVSVILSKIIKENNIILSDLFDEMKKFPQILLNKKVENKIQAMQRKELLDEIKKEEEKIQDKGRILVRSSGTEELVRVMVEHEDIKECEAISQRLMNYVY